MMVAMTTWVCDRSFGKGEDKKKANNVDQGLHIYMLVRIDGMHLGA